MLHELSWKVGGQQGEGIDSTGKTFSTSLNRMGYYIYSYRHFSSRIKGGHTNDNVRVTTSPKAASADYLDILVAFDQETIDLNGMELRDGGVVIADAKFNPKLSDKITANVKLVVMPFTKIAEEHGAVIMKNMVALGATARLVGLDVNFCTPVLQSRFGRKSQKIVDQNLEAIQAGFDAMDGEAIDFAAFKLVPPIPDKHLFMIGNDAIAFGALAAGARIMPAYPITPASDVMEYLIKKLPKVGGVVVQTEDEIAALNMTIGAAYAGARTLTATSGPGLSLMMEALGLAGMTETPVVIIDTQRGGPSTGLPTKHEQSDMYAVLFGNHGEIGKIVLTPSSAEECFYASVDAFNYAEKYQCPVILMTDLALSLASQSVAPFDYDKVTIDRGLLATQEQLDQVPAGQMFKRYERTEDGISPRVFPGQLGGIHHVTGVEHSEIGRPDEGPNNHVLMMNKRLNKFDGIELPNSVSYTGDKNPDVLLIGVGSSIGPIDEAVDRLRNQGIKVGHAQVKVLSPFPLKTMTSYVNSAKQTIVIESNGTGQLFHLMQFFGLNHPEMKSYLKYDGTPFLAKEIEAHVKGSMIAWQR
ncbi:MAG: 2-oxoacid:acceptor oxidoreductase subunit alpha [Acidibacillus sp.]|uniref:2-oxoglutarate oxidoreductase subunit KorA n=1 Tax=Sulfoacidibacillus ferrooxidans TaxID=2005001 RepID=A0A9X1V7I7_9BACL|nr:2-oxoacid:acceptor oxidoreductase subunit alpha [Sulfoacidibacillus ferrooxidans]MCI0182991.1 2-oxoglutarate oxidoreductase subunit KorA [Sulfoacidibacillus ferrooxidans]MCY0893439.1 2-oxoacid:acceptor oxidoreductase subunit alpha [Acidibacillus sp.]